MNLGSMTWKRVVFDVVLANGQRVGRESMLFPGEWLAEQQLEGKYYLDTHIKDYLRDITYEIKSINDED